MFSLAEASRRRDSSIASLACTSYVVRISGAHIIASTLEATDAEVILNIRRPLWLQRQTLLCFAAGFQEMVVLSDLGEASSRPPQVFLPELPCLQSRDLHSHSGAGFTVSHKVRFAHAAPNKTDTRKLRD